MKKNLIFLVVATMLVLAACGNTNNQTSTKEDDEKSGKSEVNLYTSRHYDIDNDLYKRFEKDEIRALKLMSLKGEADELIERIKREGTATKADLLLTADVGRLYRAKVDGLLQAVSSDKLSKQVPANLRDADDMWIGLTKRARVIVYNKDKVKP